MTKRSETLSENLKIQLKTLPDAPGIYKFRNAEGKILYIGKAKILKNRVKSYFNNKNNHSYRIHVLVGKIHHIEYVVTNSEAEALILENNLIKEHQPKYNILLKDGKTFPYICIKKERFPRVFKTRNKIIDGSEYFGPYPSASAVNSFFDLIRKHYPLRTCNYYLSEANIQAGKFKRCLEFQIGNCAGPCEGLQSEEAYNQDIDAIRKILKGNYRPLLSQLEEKMKTAAENYEFEKAEEMRLRLERIRAYIRKNTIISQSITNVEVLTVSTLRNISIVNHFKVVDGAIIQTHAWEFRKKNEEEGPEILAAALSRMLADGTEIGNEIYSNLEIPTDEFPPELIFFVPQRGDKRKLVELSIKNSMILLEEKVLKQTFSKKDPTEITLEQLQQDLHLPKLPRHIECFDNSNFQGSNPVASLVVFKEGKPSKKDYRHFKIKTVEGPDDFASMKEVVGRRYKRLVAENQPLPDLVIVDGGKGQLSSAAEALRELDLLGTIPLFGIAKRLEELFSVNDPIPLHLDKRSPGLKMIQHLRNEAHRFAINFHRDLRSKRTTSTALTNLKGFGEATSQKLLTHFRSLKKVKAASREELESVIGKKKSEILQTAIAAGEI